MTTEVQKYIEEKIAKANYELDQASGVWVGWLDDPSNVFAQGKTVEIVRQELAEILEEFLLMDLAEKGQVKGFSIKIPAYA